MRGGKTNETRSVAPAGPGALWGHPDAECRGPLGDIRRHEVEWDLLAYLPVHVLRQDGALAERLGNLARPPSGQLGDGMARGLPGVGFPRHDPVGIRAPAAPSSFRRPVVFWQHWGQSVCAPDWMANEIAAAANAYGVSYWTLMSVAACESNFRPETTGWPERSGFTSGPRRPGPGSGRVIAGTPDQIWATARAFAWGYASHWVCYGRI